MVGFGWWEEVVGGGQWEEVVGGGQEEKSLISHDACGHLRPQHCRLLLHPPHQGFH